MQSCKEQVVDRRDWISTCADDDGTAYLHIYKYLYSDAH
jgi:hypothetical protein